MTTRIVFFPFDLFGSGGTAAGARLLADAVREMLADNRRERAATRARAYARKVRVEEFSFDEMADYTDWRERARRAIRAALKRRDFLLWVSGNHLGVLPVYDELSAKSASGNPKSDVGDTLVVQFDAHLDIYNLSDCTSELSHGNYLLHCAGPLPRLINVGHRELLLRPDYIGKYFQQAHAAADIAIDPSPALKEVRAACDRAQGIFLDLDCDVLDPAYFPATSHPMPFGLSPQTLLRFLDAAWSDKVTGLAISEFDPARDQGDRSLETLAWLVEYALLRRCEK